MAAPATLARRLGPFDAAAIVISNVIGGGIFFVPVLVANLTPSAPAMLGVWLFGGVLAFAGAMAYAELATLRPRAGGEYVYLRDALRHRRPRFCQAGPRSWPDSPASIAAGAVALADYLGRFVPAAADRTPLLSLPYTSLVVTPQALVAIAVILALSAIHLHGSGRIVHNLLAGLKVSALAAFIAIGLSLGHGSFAHLASSHPTALPGANWLLALIPVMFSYSGWNAASYVAEEVRDPSRNLPRSLAIGTFAVVVLYLALNVLFLFAMPVAELAKLPDGRLTDLVAERLFGFVAGNVLGIFTIISIAAGVSAMVLAGPRVYYAMARDGVFFARAAQVHPTYRTPVLAILAQAVWASVLVLVGNARGSCGLHGLRGRAVFRRGRARGVRAAVERAGGRAALQGIWISGGARHLRRRQLSDGRE